MRDLDRNVESLVEESLKNPGAGYSRWWLQKFNQFFLGQRYTCWKIFIEIRSVVFTWSC